MYTLFISTPELTGQIVFSHWVFCRSLQLFHNRGRLLRYREGSASGHLLCKMPTLAHHSDQNPSLGWTTAQQQLFFSTCVFLP